MSKKAKPAPDLRALRDEAVTAAGGPTRLAEILGISDAAVCQWEHIPHKRVLAVEKASGVPRTRLRPDLYPTEAA